MLKVQLVDHDGKLRVSGEILGDRTPHVIDWNGELYTMHALGTSDTPNVYRLAHVAELENAVVEVPPAEGTAA